MLFAPIYFQREKRYNTTEIMKMKKTINTSRHLIKSFILSLSVIMISFCSSCFAHDPILTMKPEFVSSAPVLSIDASNPSGIKLKTGFSETDLNLVYQHERKEFELGIVSQKFNKLLPKGMIMEFKTSLQSGSAGVLFSKKF